MAKTGFWLRGTVDSAHADLYNYNLQSVYDRYKVPVICDGLSIFSKFSLVFCSLIRIFAASKV